MMFCLRVLITLCLYVLRTARIHQSGKFTFSFEVHRGTTSWQQSSWRAEELQPHIKAPVNPRPHLPQMPQLSTHTHTSQPQSDQNRAGHGLATNPIHPIDLNASSGSPALTQVECSHTFLFCFVSPFHGYR